MRRKTRSVTDQHHDWLTQVEIDGPFVSLPVLKDMWHDGVERLGDADDRMITFKQAFLQWQRAFDTFSNSVKTDATKTKYAAVTEAWIDLVLDRLAGWQDLRIPAHDPRLRDSGVTSPGGELTVRPSGALEGRDEALGALLLFSDPSSDLRAKGLDGWAATEIDRMAMLLRKARVETGIVTDGQWWAIVWAKEGKPTGSGLVNALTWAEEPLLRDAFLTLIDQRRFRSKNPEQRLPRLFERSELEAEDITEALGTQVRKSVELLVQAFSEARLAAAQRGDPDPLTSKPDDVYQAAVTIMMRVVFLLFAEERDMLPTEQLYWDSYAIRDLLDDLKQQAAGGEEQLDETFDAWHRLLAVSRALYEGVNYDEMRMPAYGGSLLDPSRFPWLDAADHRGLLLKVPDRVMLHVLDSVQSVVVNNEHRRISFREIDVEQIGYIYEGLLGYSCKTVEGDLVLGLIGKDGEEPEITLGKLQDLYDNSISSRDFATGLVAWLKEDQPASIPKTVNAVAKLVDKELEQQEIADLNRLLTPIAGHDPDLLAQLIDWGSLIRRDLRGIPYVVPVGGVVVTETPSRKNAGAHYTPRSLAEEVVKHALEPLVYEPGPLQINDQTQWKRKASTAILNLRIADIAAGSGAFLVGAARFLADRVTEGWTEEGALTAKEQENPRFATNRAIREVIARCLYGADINPMAVEMCKLSLWLVSMDRAKPFSFVDDKIICGNSLLGITSLQQLQALHIYPDSNRGTDLLHELVDVDGKIAEATNLRNELASTIDEHEPMRSTRGKLALLGQFREVTSDLRLIADGIIATALPLGGAPGRKLDDAYKVLRWELVEAFSKGSTDRRVKLEKRIDTGLTPIVDTDYHRWQPLHWALEAPDVFVEHGGFDAIIGNPPFLVAKNISGAFGPDIREWLTNVVAKGHKGKADLAAFFLLRAAGLVRARGGEVGLLLPKSISEGDTRVVGLDQLADSATVHRSVRSTKWPSASVTVWIAKIWMSLGEITSDADCDGDRVSRISMSLEPAGRISGQPMNINTIPLAFKGSVLQGDGFLLSQEAASDFLSDSRNGDVVRPYLNGAIVNGVQAQWNRIWAIDFREMSAEEAKSYTGPWKHVLLNVWPERQQIDRSKYPRMVDQWWKHWNTRVDMYNRLRQRESIWVISAPSRHAAPVLAPTHAVLSSALVLFDSDEPWLFGVLASSVHRSWMSKWGSTMQADIRYAPSDLWVTFPLPDDVRELTDVATELWQAREGLMEGRGLGVTAALNLVDDPSIKDADVARYRETLVRVDRGLFELYGWQWRPESHDFVNYRNVTRYWFKPGVRVSILDRLLELNHQRAWAKNPMGPDARELF
jgi:type I restriction-modification system DNA methylase subunit